MAPSLSLMRAAGALLFPVLVPAVVIAALWALPGQPEDVICAPAVCPDRSALATTWGVADGPAVFYLRWWAAVLGGDLGRSWTVAQGVPVGPWVFEATLTTGSLLVVVLAALVALTVLGAQREPPVLARRVVGWVGRMPAILLALGAAAAVELRFGAAEYAGAAGWARWAAAVGVLLVADGRVVDTVRAVRADWVAERAKPYAQGGLLRGEPVWSTVWSMLLPAWVAQLRSRALALASAAVLVEVALDVPGLGHALFEGTLAQDFGLVLAVSVVWAGWGASLTLACVVAEALAERFA